MLAAVVTALGISQYFSALFLSSDLMVWKVFVPRYMLGAVELICVDVAMLVGLRHRIISCITLVFALPAATGQARAVGLTLKYNRRVSSQHNMDSPLYFYSITGLIMITFQRLRRHYTLRGRWPMNRR
jgi:hypothetical protein